MRPVLPDLLLLAGLIVPAFVFAIVVSRRLHESLSFTVALLQAITAEAALVVLASFFFPNILASNDSRNGLIAIIAMMTLIYATRDIFESFGRRRLPSKQNAARHGENT